MRSVGRIVVIVSLVVLVVNFLTLENRSVTMNALAQGIGRRITVTALAVLVCGVVVLPWAVCAGQPPRARWPWVCRLYARQPQPQACLPEPRAPVRPHPGSGWSK
jgi:hypothetical protein